MTTLENNSGRRYPLEYALDGQGLGFVDLGRASHLAGVLAAGRTAAKLKLSTDPLFVDKMRDIVDFYLDPPDHALVPCVDKKSQIQVLDRFQPLLPRRPWQAERRTHDYKRPDDLAVCRPGREGRNHHRPMHGAPPAQEFRRSLDTVEKYSPADLGIRIVMDNASSH